MGRRCPGKKRVGFAQPRATHKDTTAAAREFRARASDAALWTSGPGPSSPSHLGEVPDPVAHHDQSFCPQQRALECEVPSVSTEPAASRDDSMAGHIRRGAVAHDVADGTPGPRPAGSARDIAIGGRAARRDVTNGSKDAGGEPTHVSGWQPGVRFYSTRRCSPAGDGPATELSSNCSVKMPRFGEVDWSERERTQKKRRQGLNPAATEHPVRHTLTRVPSGNVRRLNFLCASCLPRPQALASRRNRWPRPAPPAQVHRRGVFCH